MTSSFVPTLEYSLIVSCRSLIQRGGIPQRSTWTWQVKDRNILLLWSIGGQGHTQGASTYGRRRPIQREEKSPHSWVGEGTHSWVTTTTHSWVTRPTHEWSTSSSHDSSSCFPAKEAQTGLPYPTEQKRIRFILKTYTLYSRYVYVPTKQGIRCRRKSLPPQCS